jgi:hypothetical protein
LRKKLKAKKVGLLHCLFCYALLRQSEIGYLNCVESLALNSQERGVAYRQILTAYIGLRLVRFKPKDSTTKKQKILYSQKQTNITKKPLNKMHKIKFYFLLLFIFTSYCKENKNKYIDNELVIKIKKSNKQYEQQTYCGEIPCGVWNEYDTDTLNANSDSSKTIFTLRSQIIYPSKTDSTSYYVLHYNEGQLVTFVEYNNMSIKSEIIYNERLYYKMFASIYKIPYKLFKSDKYDSGIVTFFKKCSNCHTFAINIDESLCSIKNVDYDKFKEIPLNKKIARHKDLRLTETEIKSLYDFITSFDCDTLEVVARQ